jgi:O-antigen/teichoic acid export membrane protein
MSFFRQSSWMMLCNTLAGVLMFGVHILAPSMLVQAGEYGLFIALLGVLNVMMSFTPGIQTVFTYEAVAAGDGEARQNLVRYAMGVIKVTTWFWVMLVVLIMLWRKQVMSFYKMEEPWALGITLVAGLLQLWLPVAMGMLQGFQRFSWLGWALLTNGGGRLLAAVTFVALLGGAASSAMLGALTGVAFACFVSLIPLRFLLETRGGRPVQWMPWIRRMLPLALAPVVFQLMMSADLVFFRSILNLEESDFYGIAGTLGRGLVMLLGPLAGVMFPKLIQSNRDGKANVLLWNTLLGTLVIGGLVCLFFVGLAWGWPNVVNALKESSGNGAAGGFIARVLAKEQGLGFAMDLLPWFAAGMLCLCFSNVLLSNLLAYQQYRVLAIPFIIVLGYVICLATLPQNGKHLVQLIFLFNLLLMVVLMGLVFWTGTWRGASSQAMDR